MWEIRRVVMSSSNVGVDWYSWKDGWGEYLPDDYLANFHPQIDLINREEIPSQVVIMVLLGDGWEPYAAYEDNYFFRKQVNPSKGNEWYFR